MKVLIHAIGDSQQNVARFLSGLLPALQNYNSILNSKPVYYVLVPRKIRTIAPTSKIKILKVPNWLCSNALFQLCLNNFLIPIVIKTKGINCLVTLSTLGPFWGYKQHIHFQENPFVFSKEHFHRLSSRQKIIHTIRKALLFVQINRAKKVVVPSNSMLSSIPKNLVEADPDKFIVFPHALEKHSQTDVAQVPTRMVDLAKNSSLIFLYPDYYGPQKNIFTLLRALGRLKRIEKLQFKCLLTFQLKDCGEDQVNLSTILRQEQIENNVAFLGELSIQEMDYLFRKAQCLVFPSLLESFAFPLAQALSYGLPIVAADTSINREICQNGALYYPPLDSERLAAQLKSVYDSSVRERLSSEGKSQFASRDWRWSTYVREFEKLL